MSISNYNIVKTLYEGAKSKVSLATEKNSGEKVLIKIVDIDHNASLFRTNLQNEFQILQSLEGNLKPIAFEEERSDAFMVREYFEGISLKEFINSKPISLLDFFRISIAIIEELNKLHLQGFIHKDVNPSNILINDDLKEVKVIDFDLSVRVNHKNNLQGNPELLEGTLLYISPEQTGRMNRTVDYRSDFYSLGITFYEILSGNTPFNSDDPLELVHFQIAQKATALSELNLNIPFVISKIIDKLMAKSAEERYQSLSGLNSDLEKCQRQFLSENKIDSFELGLSDFSNKLNISQKLFGREKETERILNDFERIVNKGKGFILINGKSGVGKTSLIHEIYRPVSSSRGYFLVGKFEDLQSNTPYFAWVSILSKYADLILTESIGKIEFWKNEIIRNLGANCRILTELVPTLEIILGTYEPVQEIPALESQNRFIFTILSFLKTIATEKQPLVLFLDDMQWADSASLYLLKNVLADTNLNHILIIASFRTNEVNASHPFGLLVSEIKNELMEKSFLAGNFFIDEISIDNLRIEDCNALISETLNRPLYETAVLSNLVFEKTYGNPFYINQFLLTIYEDGLLKFNDQKWMWQSDEIRSKRITQNVAELLADKISKLPPETQKYLRLASVVGNKFKIKVVAEYFGAEMSVAHDHLWPAIVQGTLLSEDVNYKYLPYNTKGFTSNYSFLFAHDKLKEILYASLSESEKEEFNYKLAKQFYSNNLENFSNFKIFKLVNHFNLAENKFDSPDDRRAFYNVNLNAANRSKKSAAFGPANISYLNCLRYFDEVKSISDSAEKFDLLCNIAETGYLAVNIDECRKYASEAKKYANTISEKARLAEILITAHTSANLMAEAVSHSFDIFSELGLNFPKKVSKLTVIYSAILTQIALPKGKLEKIIDFPVMTDELQLQRMNLINISLPAFFLSRIEIYPLLIFKMVRLSVKFGNGKASIASYGSYGLILAGIVKDHMSAYKVGNQSMLLLSKFKADEYVSQANFVFYMFINQWREGIKHCIKNFTDGVNIGLAYGNLVYAAWNKYMMSLMSKFLDEDLKLSFEINEECIRFTNQIKQRIIYEKVLLNKENIEKLITKTSDFSCMAGFESKKLAIENFNKNNDRLGLSILYYTEGSIAMHYGAFVEAAEILYTGNQYMDAVIGTYSAEITRFSQTVSYSNYLVEGTDMATKKAMRKTILSNLKFAKNLSKLQSQNFGLLYSLAEAEFLNCENKIEKTIEMFDKVFGYFKEEVNVEIKCLANFLYAKFLVKVKSPLAREAVNKAIQAYDKWGALGVSLFLQEKYAIYLDKNIVSEKYSNSIKYSQLDAITIIKSTAALTGEIVLSKLFEKLMKLSLENAGAEKGYFILFNQEKATITAGITINDGFIEMNLPMQDSNLLSPAVVNYVTRTLENVVLHNAQNSTRFNNDKFILDQQSKSILCIPFVHQQKLIGVLYLSNDLATDTFTANRVELLQVLAGQIAVSIENALLIQNLEEKVIERTKQLAEEKQKSDELLLNILPNAVAEELKQTGKSKPEKFEEVTVMFTDFKNFTRLSEILNAEQLVEELHYCYTAFDHIITKHGLEKIKTIGDSYMCAAGLSNQSSDNVVYAINAAMDIRDFLVDLQQKKIKEGKPFLEVRIGLHTGSVVAGIVGIKKFAYDIWGDTVNIASRMETNSAVSKINVSGFVYQLAKDKFNFEYRGQVKVKNKDAIEMYFVERKK